jgi:acetolactate synthase-1/2/3 large subunit
MWDGHGGDLALRAALAHGVERMFTLSGAHVFPLYDAAVRAEPPLPIVDVRHEQTAVFAAEATARLTRRPGLAVVTAGPGVTNAVSAVTTAHFNAAPVLLLGGRAPANRWGSGSLQELDHPPLLQPVTRRAATVPTVDRVAEEVDAALRLAQQPHRGPVFLDVPMDQLYSHATVEPPPRADPVDRTPDPDALTTVTALLHQAERPVLVLGSDVWLDRAETAARQAAETLGLPVVANGMGRGVLPPDHPLSVTRARATALGQADLVLVTGAPLDFRLGFGRFGGRGGGPPAQVVHLVDAADQLAGHVPLAAAVAGDLSQVFDALAAGGAAQRPEWRRTLEEQTRAARAADAADLGSDATPVHPARVYGELTRVLADDAVVIGDGGDFVSFAGRYLEPAQPGCWLDPGPYGCLGTGLGYAIAARLARPSAQVVLLLGDGAAGFSLMDVDTLVRHRLPVVMVCGNNSGWALEKHPMRFLYGYDVAADLGPQTRYDQVVEALGGAGELVGSPDEVGPALRRGLDAGVPYLVNVLTDPEVAYPRSTTGV